METGETIKVPKLEGNIKTWFKLTGGTQFKNVGGQAEVGYSALTAPTQLKGEQCVQGETVVNTRGDVYVLQDAYFSYEFMAIG